MMKELEMYQNRDMFGGINMTKKEFFEKYGDDWEQPISAFIRLAPPFEGEVRLGFKIVYLIADLKLVLNNKKD